MAIKIERQQYDWGTLTIIDGGSIKVILHPEHIALLATLADGEHTKFTDEQNICWTVTRVLGSLIFIPPAIHSTKILRVAYTSVV